MLRITSITKRFFPNTVNERIALRDVSLHLEPGDFVTIIGSNGAGKSTLLNIVSGRYRPDSGTVHIAGEDVTRQPDHHVSRHVARVFQDPMAGTAPHLTIEENLSLALARGKRRTLGRALNAEKRKYFKDVLRSLEQGLENRLSSKVGLLSGGQRQALSLTMATFSQPDILLLDEHTAALDPTRAALITKLTEKVVAREHLTTLMVTHNMDQALSMGNRLMMMHEGRIIFDLAGDEKKNATVDTLMAQFESLRSEGAQLSDRTLLA